MSKKTQAQLVADWNAKYSTPLNAKWETEDGMHQIFEVEVNGPAMLDAHCRAVAFCRVQQMAGYVPLNQLKPITQK